MVSGQVKEVSVQYQVGRHSCDSVDSEESRACPPGYKQTEIGVIPEDWDLISIDRALTEKVILDQMDGNHGELYPKSHEFSDSGVPYVGATDFYRGVINFKNCKYLSEKRAGLFKKGIAKNGDILFAHNATVGPVALVETELDFIVLSTTATYYRCNNKYLINTYLKAYFESEYFVRQYSSVMSQSTRNQVPILAQRKFFLVIPTVAEQTAIANALSDVDALITSLEKLITKKRAIKTAAMQQLLTGKKRLPPFDLIHTGYKQTELGQIPEDWEISQMSDFVASLEAGISVNSVEDKDAFNHGKAVLKTSCIAGGYFYPTEAKGIITKDLARARLNPKKDSIIISRMNTPDLVGEIGYVSDDYDNLYLPDRLWQTKYKSGVDVSCRWLAFMLSYPDISKQIKDSATGTSNSMKNISKGSFLSTLLPRPSFEEQTVISNVLFDMDKEIDTLEQRLNKTQQLKQGMMQELLTGRTRLI